MDKAYGSSTPEEAKRRLLQLAASLEKPCPSAAASVREGLDDTLTVMSLDVEESLMKTLRWGASGLLEAEKGFRRVKGYRDMSSLVRSLEALCPAIQHESCMRMDEEIA